MSTQWLHIPNVHHEGFDSQEQPYAEAQSEIRGKTRKKEHNPISHYAKCPKCREYDGEPQSWRKLFSEAKEECPICLEIIEGDKVKMSAECGHIVCNECLDELVRRDNQKCDEGPASESSRVTIPNSSDAELSEHAFVAAFLAQLLESDGDSATALRKQLHGRSKESDPIPDSLRNLCEASHKAACDISSVLPPPALKKGCGMEDTDEFELNNNPAQEKASKDSTIELELQVCSHVR